MHLLGWTGLAVIALSETLLFLGNLFVSIYFTPLVWSGYILFIDSVVRWRKGTSLLLDRPKEFLLMLPVSIGFWLVFEFYNLYIENWQYVGLPAEFLPRWLGYAWAFATIWPAILLTAAAAEVGGFKFRPLRVSRGLLVVSVLFGLICLVLPFLVSPALASYLAGPVWVGFIFLLEPFNYRYGGRSLFRDLERGQPRVIIGLLLSGFICGFLWEFWNYWAGTKWFYTVPILGHIKIFEMPVLGYLGFPPFAVECYVMYASFRLALERALKR